MVRLNKDVWNTDKREKKQKSSAVQSLSWKCIWAKTDSEAM